MLDVSKTEGIVDLSLRTELIEPLLVAARPARGKRKAAADPAMPAVCARLYPPAICCTPSVAARAGTLVMLMQQHKSICRPGNPLLQIVG